MLPQVISSEVKSTAEKRIYHWFKEAPGTQDWVVLHSLGIESHKTLLYGEVDFLVLAPNLGVFVLEVKGGRVRRENGMWIFTNRQNEENTKSRGPFEQASEALYSIQETIIKITGNTLYKNMLFGYGAMFPDIVFSSQEVDISPWQIFDQQHQGDVVKYIRNLSTFVKNKRTELHLKTILPSLEDVKVIKDLLRKDFDYVVSLTSKVQESEAQLFALTQEQYRCIDGLEDNPRCLINGLAGTGKTVLAIKEAVENLSKGKNIGFFCYNRSLAERINSKINSLKIALGNSYIGSFTDYLQSLVPPPKANGVSSGNQWFQETLPRLALEVLVNQSPRFDMIIMDEAQDLLYESYLDLFDLLLKGGLKEGEWYFFGDFTLQTIFNKNSSPQYVAQLLRPRANYVSFKLTENCRNTVPIQKAMNQLMQIEDPYINPIESFHHPVEYFVYNTPEQQVQFIETILTKLLNEGIPRSHITLLTPFKYEDSILPQINHFTVEPYKGNSIEITYSTIQGFKGLENSVILVVDIHSYNNLPLLYIAMSRARSILYLFETKFAHKMRIEHKKLTR